jgi:hypothetical protein
MVFALLQATVFPQIYFTQSTSATTSTIHDPVRSFVSDLGSYLTFLAQDALNCLIDELSTAIDQGDL